MTNSTFLQTALNIAMGIFRENSVLPRYCWSDVGDNPTNGVAVSAKDSTVQVDVPAPRAGKAITLGTFSAVDIVKYKRSFTLDTLWGDEFAIDDNEMDQSIARGVVPAVMAESMKGIAKKVDAAIRDLWYKVPHLYNITGVIADLATLHQALDEQGAPLTDRALILCPKMHWTLAQQTTLNANAAAPNGGVLQSGRFGSIFGAALDMDQTFATAKYTVAGTLTTAMTPINKAATAVALGATSFTCTHSDGGPQTLVPGDQLVFAGDTQKYTVTTGASVTNGAGGATVYVFPAIKVAMTGGEAITITRAATSVSYSYVNYLMHKNAIGLVSRRIQPPDPDIANPYAYAVDPVSGLVISIEKERYAGQTRYRLACLFGADVINENAIARGMSS